MAFTVDRQHAGYKISIGDRRPAYASTVEEVANALRHYYAADFAPNGHDTDTCPFCRQQEKRRER